MDLNEFSFGIYEKALPAYLAWHDRLNAAQEAGYDFVEIYFDETDECIARLGSGIKSWTD